LAEFVDVHVVGRRRSTVPVVDGGVYLGTCSFVDLGEIERDRWTATTVGDVMRTDVGVVGPDATLREAVAAMEDADVDVIAVVDRSGTFVGVVDHDEVVRLDEILDESERRSGRRR